MRYYIFLVSIFCHLNMKAANGDSIFNIKKIHSLYITFPYSGFYDSLLKTNTTDVYLKVDIKFNDKNINQVGIKVKGNSSFNNPSQKKSFKIDFNEFVSGTDIHGLKKLNFNNSFKDPSFMREKLANDFLREFNAPAPRVAYCNVYMNNQLWGLYTIVENIDDEFCKKWFNNDEGNLFQGDPKGTLQWKGSSTKSLYTSDYDLENNKTADDWSDLIGLIDAINNTPSNNFRTILESKFNTGNFIKQWAVLNMFASFDSYIGSGHNYYMYHDTISNKFEWIAWDNNEAFGSFKFTLTNPQILASDIFYINNPVSKPLCDKMLKDSVYKKMYVDSFCMMNFSFTNSYFDPIIDSLYNLIKPSVYSDPKKFYTNANFETNISGDLTLPGPGGINVFGLKSFIKDRKPAIESGLSANKASCASSTNEIHDATENSMILELKNNIVRLNDMYHITVLDASGRVCFEAMRTDEIDLNPFTEGHYFILVKSKGKLHPFRLFKSN